MSDSCRVQHLRQYHLPCADQCTSKAHNGNETKIPLGTVSKARGKGDKKNTYSQNLNATKSIHITLIGNCAHIPWLDETFLRIFLIIKSHRLLRVRSGLVEDCHNGRRIYFGDENEYSLTNIHSRRIEDSIIAARMTTPKEEGIRRKP
jgi:hypothetical protein